MSLNKGLIDLFWKIIGQRQDETQAGTVELRRDLGVMDREIRTEALQIFNQLDTDSRGKILFSQANVLSVSRVNTAVKGTIERSGQGIITRIGNRLLNMLGLGKKYQAIFTNPDTVEQSVKDKVLSLYGYDPNTMIVDPSGYIYQTLGANPAAQRIAEMMRTAVAGRMPKAQFIKQFQAFFTTNKGTLSQRVYANWVSDLYMIFDRALSLEYAEQLGTNSHAIYAGTLVDDSRQFCIDRLNGIYTLPFINEWNKLEWQGKRPGDVKINCGGYNCIHSFNWISKEFAEIMAEDQGIKINAYK